MTKRNIHFTQQFSYKMALVPTSINPSNAGILKGCV